MVKIWNSLHCITRAKKHGRILTFRLALQIKDLPHTALNGNFYELQTTHTMPGMRLR